MVPLLVLNGADARLQDSYYAHQVLSTHLQRSLQEIHQGFFTVSVLTEDGMRFTASPEEIAACLHSLEGEIAPREHAPLRDYTILLLLPLSSGESSLDVVLPFVFGLAARSAQWPGLLFAEFCEDGTLTIQAVSLDPLVSEGSIVPDITSGSNLKGGIG